MAESERFELSVPLGTLVFKTSAIDHSANSPSAKVKEFSSRRNVIYSTIMSRTISRFILRFITLQYENMHAICSTSISDSFKVRSSEFEGRVCNGRI